MTRPPTALVAGLLTLALTGVSSGQSPTGPPARDTLALATAKRLLVAMHAQEVLLEGLDSTFATMRKSGKSEMPPVFFDSLTGRIRRVVPQLIDSLATVYARQLSVADLRSEEHTSELQSLTNIVCRRLLEKKKRATSGE